MVKSKLMKMLNTCDIYSKQYSNYQLIHDKANSTIRKQLGMVDKLTDYNGLTELKHDKDIDVKKKQFNDLELQIIDIKQRSKDNDAKLKDLILNTKNKIAAVKEQQRINFHMNNDYLSKK